MVRVVGRRPGKQMAPFDFVLIFFIGGLTLTSMVANDRSLTNAIVQILTVASAHFLLTLLRRKSKRFAMVLDGTPLVLLKKGQWYSETLDRMSFSTDDVMSAVRSKGLQNPEQAAWAILERSGEINIISTDEEK